MPINHFRTIRYELFSRTVLPQGTFVVLLLDCQIAGIHVIVSPLERDQTPQLFQRLRAIIDAQIKGPIFPCLTGRLAGNDDDRSRLPATDITTNGLCRIERCEHAVGQIASCLFKSLRHRRPDLVIEHQVRLHRKILTYDLTCGRDIVLAGPRVHISSSINHRYLTHIATGVSCEQSPQGLGPGLPDAH